MDDLLREIKRLSARVKESESTSSSKEETTTSQPTSSKKTAKKRPKNRHKKNRGRKRRLKYIPELEADSSSFTDCTDEDIIRDYIENITADLSDSDVDVTLRKGAFLAKRDLATEYDFLMPLTPEVDETDSFSESVLLAKSQKKRRRYKRHSADGLEMVHINQQQRDRIHNALSSQYSRSSRQGGSNSNGNHKKFKMLTHDDVDNNGSEETMEVTRSVESSQVNSSSDNSDSRESSSNSPGSEADDEGEESCLETSTTSAIQSVIPWWEDTNAMICEEEKDNSTLEKSLSLIQRNDFKTRLVKTNGPLHLDSGGFAAYANHKIRNFVLHRDSSELSLSIGNKKEQNQEKGTSQDVDFKNQTAQLANLYNLQFAVEESPRTSKVVLTKTIATSEPNQDALKLFLAKEIRLRWRKHRPAPKWNPKRRKVNSNATHNNSHNDSAAYNSELMDVPLPDNNVGSQMLRSMGWMPGQGLGKDNGGITNPVKPVKRPRNLGFGHPGNS